MASKRDRLRAAQQAQLEAPPILGEADKALLGPSRRKARERAAERTRALRKKARFQSLLLAQLDTGPALAEVERELLSLPKERGPLDALSVALARLRVRLTGDGRRARRKEAEPEAIKEALVIEEASALTQEESLLGRLFGGVKAQLAAAWGSGERREVVAVEMAAEPALAEAVAPVKEGLEVECPAVVDSGVVEIVTPAATILRGMPRPYREITTLTAALEDLGANKKDGFGFVLRFGSAAQDEERESEFEVTGTGLVELSKHLVKWFGKAKDIEEIPLQVVDEGSGELKIFISEM